MYVCMYVGLYVYVCNVCGRMCMYVCMYVYVRINTCMYIMCIMANNGQ
jgi:hypothetical protein